MVKRFEEFGSMNFNPFPTGEGGPATFSVDVTASPEHIFELVLDINGNLTKQGKTTM